MRRSPEYPQTSESPFRRFLRSMTGRAGTSATPNCVTTRDSITVTMQEYYRSAQSLIAQALKGKRITVVDPERASNIVIGVPPTNPFEGENAHAMRDIEEAEQEANVRHAEPWLA